MDDPGNHQNPFQRETDYLCHTVFDQLSFSPQKGTKAPQAAGRIHGDFEKGFIMAEVMAFNDFKEAGSEAAVKVSTYLSYSQTQ